jgi:hypothetical protein
MFAWPMYVAPPKPPWGGPQIQHTPGMADDLMREIAPLLAEDGIDLNDPAKIPDTETLQLALTARSSAAIWRSSRRSASPASWR